jgi:hypothetical protein
MCKYHDTPYLEERVAYDGARTVLFQSSQRVERFPSF